MQYKRILNIILCIVMIAVFIFASGCAANDNPDKVREIVIDEKELEWNEEDYIGPHPGDVFRDYIWNEPEIDKHTFHRVTDPNVTDGRARKDLPNAIETIEINDLEGVVKVEMVIDLWGGHGGTGDKKLKINENDWLPVPESEYIGPAEADEYLQFRTVSFPIPMEYIKQGANTFEFSCGGNGWWGTWAYYGVIFRVYYDDSKSHVKGRVSSIKNGDSLDVLADLGVDTGGNFDKVSRVDYIAYLDDFDYDGDGNFREWQDSYYCCRLNHNIGTVNSPVMPALVHWDTTWIPDQEKPMMIMAYITDNNDITYATPAVKDLTLDRDNVSVKMYKPYDVPENFNARAHKTKYCKADINDSLENAQSSKMCFTTWNGYQCSEISVNNNAIIEHVEGDHAYAYSEPSVPVEFLKEGTNRLSFYGEETLHHGIEISWPGPVLKVRYEEN